jgi:replicative DNA helicase
MTAAPQLVTMLDWALHYAAAGFEVFPVSNKDKAPLVDEGFKDATTDPTTIARWWRSTPHALIGCRVPADVVILDIDPRHQGDATWNELMKSYPGLELGRQHRSGRGDGGNHVWFIRPSVPLSIKPLHDWARAAGTGHATGKRGWSCGIDILHHDQRYTILPPSLHPDTQRPYEWMSKADPVPMPNWLVNLLTKAPTTPKAAPTLRIADESSIADWYSANANWNDILSGVGWERVDGDGDSDGSTWRHPNATAAQSCSIRHGCLFVYTPNTDFEQTEEGDTHGYTRFKAWATLEHDGDQSAAARAAREMRDGPGEVYPTITSYTAADPADEWPTPTPLVVDAEPRPFPVRVLPSWMSDHAEAVAESLQVAVDMAAVLGLGALSVATIGRLKVSYPWENWTQPCGLYAVVTAPPSAGKSPTKAAMFKPLEEYELERTTAVAIQRRAHAELVDVEKNKVIAHKKAMGSDPGSIRLQEELRDMVGLLCDLEAKMPPSGRLLADDATIEALGMVMADAGGAVGVVSAEGGLFDRLAGLYNENGINLDLYLEGWSGGRHTVDRVKRESITIPAATLAVITTIQPHTLDAIGAKEVFAGRGLVARFLFSLPRSNVGFRVRGRRDGNHVAAAARYAVTLTDIARRFEGCDVVLELDDDACDLFAEWDQRLEYALAPGGQLAHVDTWAGKLRGNVLRLAALLHVGHDRHGDVSAESVADAITLADYFVDHMLAISERWGMDEGVAKARVVFDWITRNGHDEFTVRDLHASNRRQFATSEDTIPPLKVLVEAGYIRPMFDGPIVVGRGGKPSPKFAVNPAVRAVRAVRAGSGEGAVRQECQKGRNPDSSSSFSTSSPPPYPDHTARTARTGIGADEGDDSSAAPSPTTQSDDAIPTAIIDGKESPLW